MVRLTDPTSPARRGYRPQREHWRLVMLGMALVVVVGMMQQLRRPDTAKKIDRMFGTDAVAQAEVVPIADVDAADGIGADAGNVNRTKHDPDAGANDEAFARILSLAGWDPDRLAQVNDGAPLADEERESILPLLRRLKTFAATDLDAWARDEVSLTAIVADPKTHRGKLVRLAGRVRAVHRRTLPPELATRLEMPAYVECELDLDAGAGIATIVTDRIPQAWTEMGSLDEPATVSGLFVRVLPSMSPNSEPAMPHALFVSSAIAWHPDQEQAPFVSLGKAVLGSLGVDVGLLDDVQQRKPIAAIDREAFYQILDAAGRCGANQLIRFAQRNLDSVRAWWAAEEERLTGLESATPTTDERATRRRLQLAREVVDRASDGRYSVAPLFNDAENQAGQLVVVDGVARRAVCVGVSTDTAASDIERRFGIDHYWELDVFTDDSQNNPLVFCVRELPAGFPTGESIREPVRVAGFFFKSWRFGSRRGGHDETGSGESDGVGALQFAPLLIGRGPIWLQAPTNDAAAYAAWFAGVAFVVVVAAIWAAGWWLARGDRRFQERTLARRFALPDGQSLDGMDVGSDAMSSEEHDQMTNDE